MGACNCKFGGSNEEYEHELEVSDIIDDRIHEDHSEMNVVKHSAFDPNKYLPKDTAELLNPVKKEENKDVVVILTDTYSNSALKEIAVRINNSIDKGNCSFIDLKELDESIKELAPTNRDNGINFIEIHKMLEWIEEHFQQIRKNGSSKDAEYTTDYEMMKSVFLNKDFPKLNFKQFHSQLSSESFNEDTYYLESPLKFVNNDCYYGGLGSNLCMEGVGTYFKPGKSLYRGFFQKGFPSQFGVYIDGLSENIYIGEFREGKPHGKGEFYSFTEISAATTVKNLLQKSFKSLNTNNDNLNKSNYVNSLRLFNTNQISKVQNSNSKYKLHVNYFDENQQFNLSNKSKDLHSKQMIEGFPWFTCLDSKDLHTGFSFNIYYYYTGEFSEGLQERKGREWFMDSTVYEGEFKSGLKNGEGTFYWEDGSTYSGSFLDGLLSGKGRVQLSDGRHYEGYLKNGKLEGEGTYKWEDGSSYTGEYKNFKKHGQGSYSYNFDSDTKYEGTWFDGKQHGEGQFTSKDKNFLGIWRLGKNIQQSSSFSTPQS